MEYCEVEGCPRPVNKDGACFKHKMASVRFNGGARLKREREENYTQAEIAREIFDGAKADGKDIQQVRGRRTATEKRSDAGKWEKV